MHEKRYDILIPEHTEISILKGKLRPTQAEAQAILDQCKAIVEKNEERLWRRGDIVVKESGFYIYRAPDNWMWFGERFGTFNDCHVETGLKAGKTRYLFNIADIIKQGPIIVGLTGEEAEHLAGACIGRTCEHRKAIEQKIESALDACRERKAQ